MLAWRLSNTLGAEFCVEALEEALFRHSRRTCATPPEATSTPMRFSADATDCPFVFWRIPHSAWVLGRGRGGNEGPHRKIVTCRINRPRSSSIAAIASFQAVALGVSPSVARASDCDPEGVTFALPRR